MNSRNLYLIPLLITCLTLCSRLQSQTIYRVAGKDSAGYNGDGIVATTAKLALPANVIATESGVVYIADNKNKRIRKVDPSGVITTIAGKGLGGYSGDGGPATAAQMNEPNGLAIDAAGNIYIAEILGCRVRKVNTAGIITTIAGTGMTGYSGDGGPATAANLWNPNGVAADGHGNVYISEFNGHRIRRIDAAGNIYTYCGNGMAAYSGDNGPATAASIQYPGGIALDHAGNLYIADAVNFRIRKVAVSGIITTIAGTGTPGSSGDGGPATAARLANPTGVAIDGAGNIYIADNAAARIRKIATDGTISTVAGGGTATTDGGPATAALFAAPGSIGVTCNGNIYISDAGYSNIRLVAYPTLCVAAVENVAAEHPGCMSISPNPGHGHFNLNVTSAAKEQTKVMITDMTSKPVKEWMITTNEETEVTFYAPPGIYLLSATTKDGRLTAKIVVE